MKQLKAVAALLFAVGLAACQPTAPSTVAPTSFEVPAGSVQLSNPQVGYTASVPAVVNGHNVRVAGADFAFRSDADGMFMTLSSGTIGGATHSELFAAEWERLTNERVFVEFADLLEDRFVIFGISATKDVVVTVTQFGEDCDGTPVFATATNGFNNETTPIEFHFTNTHPNYPRFNFQGSCG
ncbi:hypothetical protein N9O61_06325 [Octadecabacter sp.]|nr:hypothetical protein [Octadecabacter sp.]